MRKLLSLFIASLFFANAGHVRADGQIPSVQFFAGSYRVVGVDPETQIAYQGLCEIVRQEEGHYLMRRTIDGKIVEATFRIEDHENHEGTKWKVLVARYSTAGKDNVITYTWKMANLFVEDNYGLLVGTIVRSDKEKSRRTVLRGFETLIPTTESADSFRSKLKKEIEDLRSEGLRDVDAPVARAVRVFKATSPRREERRGTSQPAAALESKSE